MKLRNKVTTTKGVKYELDKEVFTGDYWVDGKPIFLKTIYSATVNNDMVIALNINRDSLVKLQATATANNTVSVTLPYSTSGGNLLEVISHDKNTITVWANGTYKDLYVTIFYTKLGV